MSSAVRNYRVQLVEYVIPAGNTGATIQFTDQPYLRNKKILGLAAYNANDFPVSPLGNAVITLAQMQTCFVNFYTTDPGLPKSQGLWIQGLPLIELHQIQNASADPFQRDKFLMAEQGIYWEKTNVTLAPGGLANDAPVSFMFLVMFMDAKVDPSQPSD